MIFIGLGSNLSSTYGDRFKNIDLSIDFLESYKIKLISKSSYYESLSYPDKSKPKFINIVISVDTNLPLIDLMSVLIFIEEKLERKRKNKNDPRTCDIDIIDYKGQIHDFNYKNFSLSVPHKNLFNRNFVLFPLQEIAPDWRHPKTQESVSSLIKKLPENDKNTILNVKKII